MTRRLLVVLLAAAAVLAGCTSTPTAPRAVTAPTTATATPSPSPARVVWDVARTWPVENPALTPGETVPGCTYPVTTARAVPAKVRALVLARYHYTGPTDINHMELDHKQPHALCGTDTADNLWPEMVIPGYPTSKYIHNPKDALEDAIASKVRHHRMTLAAAQKVFAGDWRAGYCAYVKHPGIDCAPWA